MKIKLSIVVLGIFWGSVLLAQETCITSKQLHRKYQLQEKFADFQLENISLPEKLNSFSFEAWLVNHVNQPVGFCLLNEKADTLLQYYNHKLKVQDETSKEIKKGYKKYWHHLVVNFNDQQFQAYHNGSLILEGKSVATFKSSSKIIINGLLDNEPFMQLNDLLKIYSIYSQPLSESEVSKKFDSFSFALDEGVLPGSKNQLVVDPFVSIPTHEGVNISWETTSVSTAELRYGKAYPLQKKLKIDTPKNIHNIQLKELSSGTNYFAELEVNIAENKQTHRLSFKTAQEGKEAFRFGVLGDTESRPFINALVGNHIWGDRPDFFVLLGDITDGGKKPYKDQWTMEFFTGTNALMQRVPVIPLAGNGDSDLHWFNQYFNPPNKEAFYKYSWSNADFFILHSTKKDELASDGKQYKWLESELKKSEADWKFVLLHYAAYSSDENDYGNGWEGPTEQGDPKVRKLVPLFEEYRVDMVFYGHLHCYERTWPIYNNKVDMDGVTYIVSGGGGGNLENFTPHRAPFSAKTYRGYNYSMVNIFENSLRLDTYNVEGELIDFVEIKK